MSYADLLINTATIQRFTETGAYDAYGQPVKVWADIYTDEPCRLTWIKGVEIKIGQEVYILNKRVYLLDVDIINQDRIIIDSLIYDIKDVIIRQDAIGQHHKECLVEIAQ